MGVVKCNVDAAFNRDLNCIRVGICIRDHTGNFVLAKTVSMQQLLNVKEGEALGLLESLKWMEELQVEDAIFESDCKLMVDQLYRCGSDLTEFGNLLDQCRAILSRKPRYRVGFVKRQANSVAHTLAGAAPFDACAQFFSFVPDCIARIVLNEML